MQEGKLVGLDIETACNVQGCIDKDCKHALDPHRSKITVIGITDGDKLKRVFRGPDKVQQLVSLLTTSPDISFTAHNGKFDVKHLIVHGAPRDLMVARWLHDSSLLAFTHQDKIPQSWLDSYEATRRELNKNRRGNSHRNAGPHSLKTTAPYYLGVAPFWEAETYDNDEYVLKDAEYSLRLTNYMLAKLPEDSIRFYSQRYLPWTKNLLDAELAGIRLDIAATEAMQVEVADKLTKLEAEIDELWAPHFRAWIEKQERELEAVYTEKAQKALGKSKQPTKTVLQKYDDMLAKARSKLEPLNIGSPTQLTWLLRERLGLDPRGLDGSPSTDKEALELLSEQNADVKKLLEARKLKKLLTAFLPEYLDTQVNGRIHTNFNVTEARTGRLSSSNPNCLTLDTQLLTDKGFKYKHEIDKDTKIAQFNKETKEVTFTENYSVVERIGKQEVIEVSNQHISIAATLDHRIIYENAETGRLVETTMDKFPYAAKILHGGFLKAEGELKLTENEVRFIVALQADAEITGNLARFIFKKDRKIVRLTEILTSLNIDFQMKLVRKNTCTEFKVRIPSNIASFLTTDKLFNYNILRIESSLLLVFLNEIPYWDGLFTRRESIQYVSKHKQNAEVLSAVAALCGMRSKVSEYKWLGKSYWRSYIHYRNYSRTDNVKRLKYEVNETWCVSVPDTYIITYRGGVTQVIGNCQQVPSDLHKLFVADDRHVLITRDLSAIEPTVLAYYSEDPQLCKLMIERGDFHSTNAHSMFKLECEVSEVKKLYPKYRQVAKTVGLAVLYGCGANQVHRTLLQNGLHDFTLADAKAIVYRIRDLYAGVWNFKKELDREMERGSIIYNILGRPLRIQDPQDAYMKSLNTLIQSSASDLLQDAAYKLKIWHGYQPLLLVHDEVVFQVPEHEANEAAKVIETTMVSTDLNTKFGRIPIKVEGKQSREWEK